METQTRAHIPRKESWTGVPQPIRETAITSVPRSVHQCQHMCQKSAPPCTQLCQELRFSRTGIDDAAAPPPSGETP
eukprot:11899298-Heterocapsa_arctica.AAC.1